MPFRTFNSWLFDGNSKSRIPSSKINEKTKEVIVPDILKYNSPITNTFVLSMFVNYPNLNKYLDSYLNNISLRYLNKEEFFYFIKQCVKDFGVNKYKIPFVKRNIRRHTLFSILRKKIPILKDYEIFTLCDIIDNREDKDQIYNSLGVKKIKKEVIKKSKKKKIKSRKISLEEFLKEFFVIEGEYPGLEDTSPS